MSEIEPKIRNSLVKASSILRTCLALADRLLLEGVVISLSKSEEEQLLNFEQLVQSNYSESDWSYLRVASGVKINGVAALTSCLRIYRSKKLPEE
ncbi:hypothetical protein [Candidatus Chlorohelix sp.]|uniref:hypothetical protein n=1 Tax=Candidatus Chlorohelix sp. TaxID=3139201 RepID=UPI00305BC098